MSRKISILLVFILLALSTFAQQQTIKIDAQNLPLNELMVQLRDVHNIQLSFNHNELSKYTVTLSQQFASPDEAINQIFLDLPFDVKKKGDVFVIVPQKKKKSGLPKPISHTISGQVVEAGSFEPLPFSHILINNNRHLISDINGAFSYTASADSTFRVQVSHLGYFIFDTLLYSGAKPKLELKPSIYDLSEVEVLDNLVSRAALIGEQPGNMKINHSIARFLPGQGDNSVFNLIRLMPGVQAAGEQNSDLLIWGSYEGQSQITFDGFTLFGLKNYNDNISVVNPFMVKNIEVFKGGYDARFGNRVGGIVNITGINGTLQKPSFNFNVNTATFNALAEIPFRKKSSLVVALRHSFYNLYNPDDFNIFAPTRPQLINGRSQNTNRASITDVDVYPDDYLFRDLNLKYTINFNNNSRLFVSAYGGGDRFSLNAQTEVQWKPRGRDAGSGTIPLNVNYSSSEQNTQRGFSLNYSFKPHSRVQSSLLLTHSAYNKQISDSIQINSTNAAIVSNRDLLSTVNTAKENALRFENTISLNNGHQIETGSGLFGNRAYIANKITLPNLPDIDQSTEFRNTRLFFYFNDILPLGPRLTLKTGARANWVVFARSMFFEPRVSIAYKISGAVKAHAAWGIYNQYTYKMASVDKDNNYTWLWVTARERGQVLGATHWVGGLNFFQNGLTINLDTYYKTTRNLIRRVYLPAKNGETALESFNTLKGNARTYGFDLFVKKDFGHHAVWATYTLSKADEALALPLQQAASYVLAPHDQRHELKMAALFKLGPIYLSGNYVYGSGMQILRDLFPTETDNVDYSRFDAAITWKFNGKLNGETGLSVLNVFDTYNLKYANLKNINLTQ
ncbi:MAG: TonB-dependent receptor, partial [Prolixibacteraceae bacterium]|nr:TonB-dependent receptor [Prolixibacteraceae bacterium]